MKKYNNLYKEICSVDNIILAHERAKRGKKYYTEVKMVDDNPKKYLLQIHKMLVEKTYKTSEYKVFIKNDSGKSRVIYKLPYYPDRIIHHCIMNILEPVWTKIFIRDTFSSLKNRGIHDGLNRLKKSLLYKENTKYCLKLDIKKFYPSIDHNILKKIVRKKIKDNDLLELLDSIIDSAEGVPIGNYLSQYFGNLYLTYFDHWMKETHKCKHYFRYCDDIVILHKDKNYLHQLRKRIETYIDKNLNLQLKENWQVFPVNKRAIDFLGYRFYHRKIFLRKSIAKKFKRKTINIKKNHRILSKEQILNSIMSYFGWFKYCKCKYLWDKRIDCNIKTIVHNVCKNNNTTNPLVRR